MLVKTIGYSVGPLKLRAIMNGDQLISISVLEDYNDDTFCTLNEEESKLLYEVMKDLFKEPKNIIGPIGPGIR